MDPSAAPWRVLESSAASSSGGGPPADPDAPPARGFLISPVTAAAIVGAIVLAIGAFLLASASTGAGVVDVRGGGGLSPLAGAGGSAGPGETGDPTGAGTQVLVVEIAGAVLHPGVFRMPVGSRDRRPDRRRRRLRAQARCRRAPTASSTWPLGWPTATGSPSRVVTTPRPPTSGTGTVRSRTRRRRRGSGRIDLNRATAPNSRPSPGSGRSRPRKIIAAREESRSPPSTTCGRGSSSGRRRSRSSRTSSRSAEMPRAAIAGRSGRSRPRGWSHQVGLAPSMLVAAAWLLGIAVVAVVAGRPPWRGETLAIVLVGFAAVGAPSARRPRRGPRRRGSSAAGGPRTVDLRGRSGRVAARWPAARDARASPR